MIPRILIMSGNSGSGKSELLRRFTPRLESLGYIVSLLVDRKGLEGSVLYDAYEKNHGFSPDSGTHLIGDGTLSSVVVEHDATTGRLRNFRSTLKGAEILNEPKEAMLKVPTKFPLEEHHFIAMEWTTGLLVPKTYLPAGKEDLMQTSSHLAERLRTIGLLGQVLIFETFAPIEDRVKWNNERGEDAIEENEFRKLFPDGDRMPESEVAALGDHYHFFDNSGTNPTRFEMDADKLFRDIIVPRLGIRDLYESGLPPRARR